MAEKKELKSLGYEIFIGVLSILSIFNIVLGFLIPDQDLTDILNIMNWSVQYHFHCVILLTGSLTAPSKSKYFFRQFGWADLLASLPFEQLRY